MGKGNGTTRSSSSGSPNGLGRNSEIAPISGLAGGKKLTALTNADIERIIQEAISRGARDVEIANDKYEAARIQAEQLQRGYDSLADRVLDATQYRQAVERNGSLPSQLKWAQEDEERARQAFSKAEDSYSKAIAAQNEARRELITILRKYL